MNPRVVTRDGIAPDFAYSGSELEALNEGQNYYGWLVERFRPWLGKNVVEVGAGIGTFALHLLTLADIETLVAVEPATNTFLPLETRLAPHPRATAVQAYISQLPAIGADSIVAVNVLEHVDDHLGFLRDAFRITAGDGRLLLYVPALPQIYGTLDVALEHHRRYTKKSLSAVIEDAGWKVREMRYVNFPGVAAWFIVNRILRQTSLTRDEVRFYDRWIIPVVKRLENHWSPPIGQSLLAIASKS